MDPAISTATVSSAMTSISSQPPPPNPSHLLELSLISAQDLAPVTKPMRTYAVTWVDPARKLSSRIDQRGHTNPTWNEKFVFRVDNDLLISEEATVNIEIYTISWFRDVLVGTVCVLMSDLITPWARTTQHHRKNTRFVALQVRRPSGNPQGMLNMGVALIDSTMRSVPLHNYANTALPPTNNFRNATENSKKANSSDPTKVEDREDGGKKESNTKIQLWRSLSMGSEVNNEDFPLKPGSICNGSIINGSELCSDIGPSASIVAAELARKSQPPKPANQRRLLNKNTQPEETGSSILEEMTIEEARAKGCKSSTRWRKEMSTKNNDNDDESDQSELLNGSKHSRRHSDGGLFSCFAYGIEFTIVCGASNNSRNTKLLNNNNKSRKKKLTSEASSA